MTTNNKPMKVIANKKIGMNRGKRRLWLEGTNLLKAGFERYGKYDVSYDDDKIVIQLWTCNESDFTVAGRTRGGKDLPIIDINNDTITKYLESLPADHEFKITYYYGRIIITDK